MADGMTHEELKDKLLKCMGGKPPISARESWGQFVLSKGTSFRLSWDWVKDLRIEKWAENHPDLEAYDTVNGLTISIWETPKDKNGRPLGGLKGTVEDK